MQPKASQLAGLRPRPKPLSAAMVREQVAHIKSEANAPKHELIRLIGELEAISPRQADALGRILARLERWQNT